MRVDVSKLRGRIVEKFGTIDCFAEKANCSRTFISKYLNHKTYLNQETLLSWATLLELNDADIPAYFLTLEVDKTELE